MYEFNWALEVGILPVKLQNQLPVKMYKNIE